jgi:hypothetical protein
MAAVAIFLRLAGIAKTGADERRKCAAGRKRRARRVSLSWGPVEWAEEGCAARAGSR